MPDLEQTAQQLCLPFQTRAILFDLDDTLHHRSKAFRGWAWAFAQSQCQTDQRLCLQLADYLVELDDHGYRAREDFFERLKHDYPFIQGSTADMIADYQHEVLDYVVLEQEIELLVHSLRAAHIPFGIVTNGVTRQQKRKMERLGLDKVAACVFISQEFGTAKPDSAIFLAAARCLESAPQDILFVGDHPRFDMWGAHEVGMRTIWVHHSTRRWPEDIARDVADITVHSFAELLAVLGMMEASAPTPGDSDYYID